MDLEGEQSHGDGCLGLSAGSAGGVPRLIGSHQRKRNCVVASKSGCLTLHDECSKVFVVTGRLP